MRDGICEFDWNGENDFRSLHGYREVQKTGSVKMEGVPPLKRKEKDLEKEQWIAAVWDMLYLIQCGIHSVVPEPERVAKMDLEKVYAKSKTQSLEALVCMALESLMQSNPEVRIPDERQILPQWKEEKNKAVAKNLMMDAAREQLFAFLEEHGIWHVALKGVVLCRIYPKYGMRQMADNDILFDPSFRREVHDWFVRQQYEVESYQISNHDEYHKKPVYNFEMHTALFKESEQPQLAQYYLTIREKLVQKPGTAFEYYMTDEDFYLYLVAHEYKHHCYAGTGFRSLLDLYVCNQVYHMDRSYLDQELNKMGLSEFEYEMRNLAQKVWDSKVMDQAFVETLSEKEQQVFKEMASGTAYGTMQRFCDNQLRTIQTDGEKISANAKLRYLMRRLFPDKDHMEKWCQQRAPYFLQHRWLLSMAPFWRIIRGGIRKRKQIKEELDGVRKA